MTDSRGRVYSRKPGRPSLRRDGARFSVRVWKDERERLEQVAAENGITVTELLRLAVNTLVEDYREGELVFIRKDMQIASIVRRA